ncbi:MAG: hypothetical protein KDM63_18670 [Verrucomicrobiae bacterium]|nr:hypothetical protein [Verrucomicrobiae bacterium]MCB1089066.1 hypothetical protein [Verrucomicrobiae bacterium]
MNATDDPRSLRPLLHEEVDRLSDDLLEVAHRALLEIEIHQVAGDLDGAADLARESGKLSPESIAEAVAAHRSSKPYRR